MSINQTHYGSGDNVAGDKYSITPKPEVLEDGRTQDGDGLELLIGDRKGMPIINLHGRITSETPMQEVRHAVVAPPGIGTSNAIVGVLSADMLSYSFNGSLQGNNQLLVVVYPYQQVHVIIEENP